MLPPNADWGNGENMDQNTALQKLLEIADLSRMVEDLVAPGNLERLAPASLSGIRVTLRAIRETTLACHDSLAGELSQRARPRVEADIQSVSNESVVRTESPAIVRPPVPIEQPRMVKKDLRSSLGQLIERSTNGS